MRRANDHLAVKVKDRMVRQTPTDDWSLRCPTLPWTTPSGTSSGPGVPGPGQNAATAAGAGAVVLASRLELRARRDILGFLLAALAVRRRCSARQRAGRLADRPHPGSLVDATVGLVEDKDKPLLRGGLVVEFLRTCSPGACDPSGPESGGAVERAAAAGAEQHGAAPVRPAARRSSKKRNSKTKSCSIYPTRSWSSSEPSTR
jgi:hypothetical protein